MIGFPGHFRVVYLVLAESGDGRADGDGIMAMCGDAWGVDTRSEEAGGCVCGR